MKFLDSQPVRQWLFIASLIVFAGIVLRISINDLIEAIPSINDFPDFPSLDTSEIESKIQDIDNTLGGSISLELSNINDAIERLWSFKSQ